MLYLGMNVRSGIVHEMIDRRYGCSNRARPADEAVVEHEWHHEHAPSGAEIKLLFGEQAREAPCRHCFDGH